MRYSFFFRVDVSTAIEEILGDEEIFEKWGNRRKNRREAPIFRRFWSFRAKKKNKKRLGFDFFEEKSKIHFSEIKKRFDFDEEMAEVRIDMRKILELKKL